MNAKVKRKTAREKAWAQFVESLVTFLGGEGWTVAVVSDPCVEHHPSYEESIYRFSVRMTAVPPAPGRTKGKPT
jgi:hypothetical protein